MYRLNGVTTLKTLAKELVLGSTMLAGVLATAVPTVAVSESSLLSLPFDKPTVQVTGLQVSGLQVTGLDAKFMPICTGFDSAKDRWGLVGSQGPEDLESNCPEDHAFLSLRNGTGPQRAGSLIPVSGTCCPLPKDALTDTHVHVLERCPPGYVLTGTRQQPADGEVIAGDQRADRKRYWGHVRNQYLRCTEIDHTQYQLGAVTSGWNVGWYATFSSALDRRTSRARIPAALRYGLGRTTSTGFSHTFCVGRPWGSIVVGRTSKYCADTLFTELLRRPNSLSGSAPEPVFDFSSCGALANPLSRSPQCR